MELDFKSSGTGHDVQGRRQAKETAEDTAQGTPGIEQVHDAPVDIYDVKINTQKVDMKLCF